MNVTDLPRPADRSEYDEAVARYADMVKSRAISVYRVGNVRYPGLSDIDLLVVADSCNVDNRYFYSAMQRMPRRYLRLFLHEPFILPAWTLRVMRHTTHYAPQLLAGRDVIRAFGPSDEPDERWCRMLEGYCTYARFAARVRETQTLAGRMTVAVASAFRFPLRDAHTLWTDVDHEGYAQEIDALRAGFFERERPEAAVEDAWELFSRAFDAFDARLQSHFGTSDAEETQRMARSVIRGEREIPYLDREYAFERVRAIDGYHHDLASMGFPYGHLFFVAAHPGALQLRDTGSVVGSMVRNVYRVRRRLEEFAGA